MRNTLNDYVVAQLGQENTNRFALWSFGAGYEDCEPIAIMKRWNRLHKNLLLLRKDGDIKSDLLKMIEIWKKENP